MPSLPFFVFFNFRTFCFLFLFLFSSTWTAEYHLQAGSENGNGTKEKPWGTFQEALPKLEAGDVVWVHEGVYHEEVDLANVSGVKGEPIHFKAVEGDSVVLSGVEKLELDWKLHEGGIYKSSAKAHWQLFQNRQALTLARFPNAKVWSEEAFNTDTHWRKEGGEATNGLMIDAGQGTQTQGALADLGVSLEGAVAVMNLRNWHSYAKLIESHEAGSNEFTYAPSSHYSNTRGRYFVEGLAVLDTMGEWFYTKEDSSLYYYPSSEMELEHEFYGRTLDFFFKGNDKTAHLVFEGFEFFASAVNFKKSESITLKNNRFLYAATSKRTLGETGGLVSIEFEASKNANIIGNEFKYMDGYGLFLTHSNNPEVADNEWYMVDYASLGVGYTIHAKSVDGLHFHHNKIKMAGASEGLRVAPRSSPALVEFNWFERMGLTQTDGAAIQCTPMNLLKSVFRNNWFLHNDRTGLRFDGDPGGTYGIAYKNVSYKSMRGFRIKGDYHQVYNNTALEASFKNDIVISIDKGGCENCITRNNAAQKFSGKDKRSTNQAPIPGTQDHNFIGWEEESSLVDELVAPEQYDFRPHDQSILIDAGIVLDTLPGVTLNFEGEAPDQGAYEWGKPYWVPGPRKTLASGPIPESGKGWVEKSPTLFWREAQGGESYRFYLDTSLVEVAWGDTTSLAFQGEQSKTQWDINGLETGTLYYWRVDVKREDGWLKGRVWNFTVNAEAKASSEVLLPEKPVSIFNAPLLIHSKKKYLVNGKQSRPFSTNQKSLYHKRTEF